MKEFKIVPKIVTYETEQEFLDTYRIGKGDLIITSKSSYEFFLQDNVGQAKVLMHGDYQKGEPTDDMVEKMYADIKEYTYGRVFGIGGGSVLDVAKLFALRKFSPVTDLFERKIEPVKEKELILIPTTCGTGSEVTNISILELKSKNTKMGLADDALFANSAVLIPTLLSQLPFSVLATSSMDAFIHATESYLSPKASDFTEIYSVKAMNMILQEYQKIVQKDKAVTTEDLNELLTASTYAGIAFGNAGCAAVHATSYPLGAAYHVPHGESNYAMLMGVLNLYQNRKPEGKLQKFIAVISDILSCDPSIALKELDSLLSCMVPKKRLREYGMTENDIRTFTDTVMTKQGRLMANNYTELKEQDILELYSTLF